VEVEVVVGVKVEVVAEVEEETVETAIESMTETVIVTDIEIAPMTTGVMKIAIVIEVEVEIAEIGIEVEVEIAEIENAPGVNVGRLKVITAKGALILESSCSVLAVIMLYTYQ